VTVHDYAVVNIFLTVCVSSDPYVRLSLCSNSRDYVHDRWQTKTMKKVWIYPMTQIITVTIFLPRTLPNI